MIIHHARWRHLLFLAFAALLSFAVAAKNAPEYPRSAAVASANAQATDAGLKILADGGNAFDAAIAVSASLGLVEPESSGLGGGGFMLLYVAAQDRYVFIDAREVAPAAATRDMYLDVHGKAQRDRSVNGALAAAIPGMPAGLEHLAVHYGSMPMSRSLQPVIRQARGGWRFSRKNSAMLNARKEAIAQNPEAAHMFMPGGKLAEEGDVLRNPDYANTLNLLAKRGAAGLYEGNFARRWVAGVRAAGGIWTEKDLQSYRVVEREPIRFKFADHEIITVPPPSSGGITIAQVLKILDGTDYWRVDEASRAHLLIEAFRRAYRDRAEYLGDPDFVDVPLNMLMSDEYAAGLRAGIHPQLATPSRLLPGIITPERESTSHFSIIDAQGNMIAVTQTVNLPYGNAVMIKGTGFMLNNEMDDFSVSPGVPNAFGLVSAAANAIEPGKRPLSSMSPSFVIGPERTAIIGTPGGSRIPSMVLQGVLSFVQDDNAAQIVAKPRIHHQYLPDAVSLEVSALSEQARVDLRERGHEVAVAASTWGNMQLVIWNRKTGDVEAASDPRWEGVGKGSSATEAIFR